MKATFNVLTDPWIPVVGLDGTGVQLGILDTLQLAHKLKGISDSSPQVEYSLYRLLTVFLMDAFRPEEIDDLEDLRASGKFDMDTLKAYISDCTADGASFDLFDEERPFLQSKFDAKWDKELKPVTNLDTTIPNGNNHTHFDHRKNTEISFTYPQAARYLLTSQIFCTAGAQGYPSNVYGAPPYFMLIQGGNLYETLVNAMLPTNFINNFDETSPVRWRSDRIIVAKEEVASTSWLYGMLFPTRRCLLVPDAETETICKVYFSQGMNYTNKEGWTDPHVTYRITANGGKTSFKPDHERAIWRNLNDLVGTEKSQILKLYCDNFMNGKTYVPITLYGVQTNQASYIAVLRHDLELPAGVLQDDNGEKAQAIGGYISTAESAARSIENAFSQKRGKSTLNLLPEPLISQTVRAFYASCETMLMQMCEQKLSGDDLDFEALQKESTDQITAEAKRQVDRAFASARLSSERMLELSKQLKWFNIQLYKLKGGNENESGRTQSEES